MCAQAPTGSVSGVVRDPSGGAVSTARIKVLSTATGAMRTVTTSPLGDYSCPGLQAGAYEVSVEAPGFQRTLRQAIVEAGATTTTDFALHVGDVTESVTVEGATAQMHYDSNAIGNVVTQSQIEVTAAEIGFAASWNWPNSEPERATVQQPAPPTIARWCPFWEPLGPMSVERASRWTEAALLQSARGANFRLWTLRRKSCRSSRFPP